MGNVHGINPSKTVQPHRGDSTVPQVTSFEELPERSEEQLFQNMRVAVDESDLPRLETLLGKRWSAEWVEKHGPSIFLQACKNNKPDVVEFLLTLFKGKNVVISVVDGLYTACFEHPEVIKMILKDKDFPVFSKKQCFVKGTGDRERNDGAVTIEYKQDERTYLYERGMGVYLGCGKRRVFVLEKEFPKEWIEFLKSKQFMEMRPGSPIMFQDGRLHDTMFASLQNINRTAILIDLFYDVSDYIGRDSSDHCYHMRMHISDEKRRTRIAMAEPLAAMVKFAGMFSSDWRMRDNRTMLLVFACRCCFDELVVELLKNDGMLVTTSDWFTKDCLNTMKMACQHCSVDTVGKLLEDKRIAQGIVNFNERRKVLSFVDEKLKQEKEWLTKQEKIFNQGRERIEIRGRTVVEMVAKQQKEPCSGMLGYECLVLGPIIEKQKKDIEKLEGIRDCLYREMVAQRRRVVGAVLFLDGRCSKVPVFFGSPSSGCTQVLELACLDSALSELKAGTALPENNTPKPT